MIQLASYDFSTFPENPLSDGGNFTKPSGFSACQVPTVNFCDATVVSTVCGAIYTGISWPNGQYSEVTIANHSSNSDTLFIALRSDTTGNNNYTLNFTGPSGTPQTPTIFKTVSGSGTLLVSGSPITFNNTDVIRFLVSGSSFSVYQNGVLIPSLNVSDSSLASGTPGFGFFVGSGSVGNVGINLWAGGNLLTSPSTQAGAFAVGP
jgi:hypothetical protein